MLEQARRGSQRGLARLRLASALMLVGLLSLTAETIRWRKSGQWPSLKDTFGPPPSLPWATLDRLADTAITFPPSLALAAVAALCACVGLRTFYRSERVIRRLEGTPAKGLARRTT